MSEWKSFCLGDVCDFSKDKVAVSTLNLRNYISTENLLQNKGGVTEAASLPKIVTTTSFDVGDILVSNIRPYFKKIWRAIFSGGCSNDVLAIRARKNIEPRFLYYVLSEDKFFDLVTATAKGTKMPRGDKQVILNYPVPDFPLETQKKIASVLSAFDDKIELNNAINKNLEEQVQAIYKNMFVDNFNPAWKSGTLSDIADIQSGKRPLSRFENKSTIASIPIFGASSIMGYTTDILCEKKILITGRVGTHGVIQRYNEPCWVSDNAFIITSRYYEYCFQILRSVNYRNLNRGSTQPLITQTDLKKLDVILPSEKILLNFEELVGSLMRVCDKNYFENKKLGELRDALLPRLMSGEIDVSKVEV